MRHKFMSNFIRILLFGIIVMLYQGYAAAQDNKTEENNGEVETLTRGAVHEAYAEPQDQKPAKGQKVSKEPPKAIEEIAPDEKPEGDNVEWIQGYWAWDDDREDFIWISGIWRVLPPDRSWVPGYWAASEEGWVWTPGFWMSTESEEVEYIKKEPPKSLEVGPPTPPPTVDDIWVSGSWVYVDARYAWRPGHWVKARTDWVWTPPHYVWTPRGYIFVDGYWDHSLERRGVIFAPVYIPHHVYVRPVFVHRPTVVIQTTFITDCLFISASSHHFYFGDFYEDRYVNIGIRPWFHFDAHFHFYDPIFVHHRWHHGRHDNHWERDLHDRYDHRRRNRDDRPARTFAEQERISERNKDKKDDKHLKIGSRLDDYARNKENPIKLAKIDEKEREKISTKEKDQRNYRDERSKWEAEKSDNNNKPDKFPKKIDSTKEPGKDTKDDGKVSEKYPKGPKEPGKDTKDDGQNTDKFPKKIDNDKEPGKDIKDDEKTGDKYPKKIDSDNNQGQITPDQDKQPDKFPKKIDSDKSEKDTPDQGNKPDKYPKKIGVTKEPGKDTKDSDKNYDIFPKKSDKDNDQGQINPDQNKQPDRYPKKIDTDKQPDTETPGQVTRPEKFPKKIDTEKRPEKITRDEETKIDRFPKKIDNNIEKDAQDEKSNQDRYPKKIDIRKQEDEKPDNPQEIKDRYKDRSESNKNRDNEEKSDSDSFQKVRVPKSPVFGKSSKEARDEEKPPSKPEVPSLDYNKHPDSSEKESKDSDSGYKKSNNDDRNEEYKRPESMDQGNKGFEIKSREKDRTSDRKNKHNRD